MAVLALNDGILESFGDNFIGVKGLCEGEEPTSGIYLDNLAGINLQNAANVAEDEVQTGKALLKKCIDNAIIEVSHDFVGLLGNEIQLKSKAQNVCLRFSGDHTFYGEKAGTLFSVKIENEYYQDPLRRILARDLIFVSDRAVTAKQFYIESDRTDTPKSITLDIRKGKNKIPVLVNTDATYVRLYWDITDFKIGLRENWENALYSVDYFNMRVHAPGNCMSVKYEESIDSGVSWVEINDLIGIDLSVSSKCDKMALAAYFRDDIALAIQYKAGILFFQEVKATKRVNFYTLNSVDKIDELLRMWNGAVDVTTGLKTHSMYFNKLKQAVRSVKFDVSDISQSCFETTSSMVVRTLPV